MKILLSLCLILAALSFGMVNVKADNEAPVTGFCENVDYMAEMLKCSGLNTPEALKLGAMYEQMRNNKIITLKLPFSPTSFFTDYSTASDISYEIRNYLDLSQNLEDTANNDGLEVHSEDPVVLTVSVTALNCRTEPDSSSQIVKQLNRGDKVTLLETCDGWCRITDGEFTGWCWGSYLSDASYSEEDLYWLALAITMEAGSNWLSDEHQLLVGNVVLNRVASDRFPDTIYDVVHQPGQYSWLGHTSLVPTERAYKNAKRLLSGERFCPPNVLFQAQFRQGSGVYASIYDSTLCTTTFFCYG